MTTKTDKTNVQDLSRVLEASPGLEMTDSRKKEFVEPQISAPVDVLEATAFFITGDSGTTN